MGLSFHKLIQRDLQVALAYYEAEGGPELGRRLFADVEATLARVSENPERHHFVAEGLRRADLRVFPYHFLYEVYGSEIQILVFRHDRRHPGFGLRRRIQTGQTEPDAPPNGGPGMQLGNSEVTEGPPSVS